MTLLPAPSSGDGAVMHTPGLGANVLVARLDSLGDVLVTGPAIRAVATTARRVTLLCGPRGRSAGALLPGVDDLVEFHAPWIDPEPRPVDADAISQLVARLASLDLDEALIFTSFHQDPLPLALLLRLAGVRRVAAICEDYPGSLLDVRHHVPTNVHEVQRALSLAATLGYRLPSGDDGGLRVCLPPAPPAAWLHEWLHEGGAPGEEFDLASCVVVHPGASVSARAWAPERHAEVVAALAASGTQVLVTGNRNEQELTEQVTRAANDLAPGFTGRIHDLGGRTQDLAGLARLLAAVAVVVVGNTGPAHLAAAVGTPVVSLFAATVPVERWRPWGVRHVILGDQAIACGGCRAKVCPVPGHPCLAAVATQEVVAAVHDVLNDRLRGRRVHAEKLEPLPTPAS